MNDLERIILAFENTKKRLDDAAYFLGDPASVRVTCGVLKILLQELHAVAKAEERADG